MYQCCTCNADNKGNWVSMAHLQGSTTKGTMYRSYSWALKPFQDWRPRIRGPQKAHISSWEKEKKKKEKKKKKKDQEWTDPALDFVSLLASHQQNAQQQEALLIGLTFRPCQPFSL
jgi:hypothetical protein